VLVLLETTPGGVLLARNTDNPENFGGLASQNRGGVSSFYGIDSQMSTRILVSIGGLVTDSYSYKVFGELIQTGGGTVNPHTYVGLQRYRQQTNGSYLLSLRLVDPFTGRFTSADPIGFDGLDWNLYRYVGNHPTGAFDPSGQVPNCDPVVYECYRDFTFHATLGFFNHFFFWVHFPCSPGKDEMIGYGPGGYRKQGQLGDDIDCIHNGTCPCNRTNCGAYETISMKAYISDSVAKGEWSPKNFGWLTHNCQNFVMTMMNRMQCDETGPLFYPAPVDKSRGPIRVYTPF
jgi:RHS repeat-associated protein